MKIKSNTMARNNTRLSFKQISVTTILIMPKKVVYALMHNELGFTWMLLRRAGMIFSPLLFRAHGSRKFRFLHPLLFFYPHPFLYIEKVFFFIKYSWCFRLRDRLFFKYKKAFCFDVRNSSNFQQHFYLNRLIKIALR